MGGLKKNAKTSVYLKRKREHAHVGRLQKWDEGAPSSLTALSLFSPALHLGIYSDFSSGPYLREHLSTA